MHKNTKKDSIFILSFFILFMNGGDFMDSIKTDYDFIHSCNRTISMLNQYIDHISSLKQLSNSEAKIIAEDILSENNHITKLFLNFTDTDEEKHKYLYELQKTIYDLSNQALSISMEKLQ